MIGKRRRSCFSPSASRSRCDSSPSGTHVAGGSAIVLTAFEAVRRVAPWRLVVRYANWDWRGMAGTGSTNIVSGWNLPCERNTGASCSPSPTTRLLASAPAAVERSEVGLSPHVRVASLGGIAMLESEALANSFFVCVAPVLDRRYGKGEWKGWIEAWGNLRKIGRKAYQGRFRHCADAD